MAQNNINAMVLTENFNFSVPVYEQAEESIIGAVIVSSHKIKEVRWLEPRDFYYRKYALIWEALCAMHDAEQNIDVVTLTSKLSETKMLDTVGGESELLRLAFAVPNSMHVADYARIVERAANRRRIIEASLTVAKMAADAHNHSLETIREQAPDMIKKAARPRHDDTLNTLQDDAAASMSEFEKIINGEAPPAMSTGFHDIDEILDGGWRGGELTFIGGVPGSGKSAFALSIITRIAQRSKKMGEHGVSVLFASQEMSRRQVVNRLVSQACNVPLSVVKTGAYSSGQKITGDLASQIMSGFCEVATWNTYTTYAGGLSPFQLWDSVGRIQADDPQLKIVLVDYIGLMAVGEHLHEKSKRFQNRSQELGYIAGKLKSLAKTFNVHVVALSALNRSVFNRADHRPAMSDFKDSGIEYDADIAMFVHREVVFNKDTEFPNQAEIIVAKNRDGRTGTANLYYESALARFVDAEVRTIDLSKRKALA